MRKIPPLGDKLTEAALRMSRYTALARQAQQQEQSGHWLAAAVLWEEAALAARHAENRAWATCRAAFCRHADAHRRGGPSQTGAW